MIKLQPDPLVSPCNTPISSRPSSVADSMIDSAIISDMTNYSDIDASSSVFSEDLDDTVEDEYPQKQKSANNSVNPNWNEIAE